MRHDAFWAVGLFAAIVVVAALVNRLDPENRSRVRRIVILYCLFVATSGSAWALHAAGETV